MNADRATDGEPVTGGAGATDAVNPLRAGGIDGTDGTRSTAPSGRPDLLWRRLERRNTLGQVVDWVEVGPCAACGRGVDREFPVEYRIMGGTLLCATCAPPAPLPSPGPFPPLEPPTRPPHWAAVVGTRARRR